MKQAIYVLFCVITTCRSYRSFSALSRTGRGLEGVAHKDVASSKLVAKAVWPVVRHREV
jgi:hypothetical protein